MSIEKYRWTKEPFEDFMELVYHYTSDEEEDCINHLTEDILWDGKSFYQLEKLSPGSTGKNLPRYHPAVTPAPLHPCGKRTAEVRTAMPVLHQQYKSYGTAKIESCAIIDLSFSGTDFHGDVAQLGERTVRIRKVESSILFVSTMPLGARQNISRLAAAGLLFY